MKYLIITGVFILGASLGYVAGTYSGDEESEENLISQTDGNSSESQNDHNHDSTEDHESEIDQSENDELDSLNEFEIDSTLVNFNLADSLNSDENISTEKLIGSNNLNIIYLSQDEEKDTAMKELLGIDEVKVTSIFVEFWESPLNFEGYKLSKKKLIVYGLSPQFDYKLYKDGSSYFLSYQNLYLKMKETQDFLPLVEVSKSEVFND